MRDHQYTGGREGGVRSTHKQEDLPARSGRLPVASWLRSYHTHTHFLKWGILSIEVLPIIFNLLTAVTTRLYVYQ